MFGDQSFKQNFSLPRDAEVILSMFARRNRGVFMLDGPIAFSGGTTQTLDVYCVFGQDALPHALLAAQNALSTLGGLDVRYHACRDSDSERLNAICSRARVFGERRRAAR